MKYEYIGHGKTREDAAADAVRGLTAALAKDGLGKPVSADIHEEVIALPKKKILGLFGGSDAEVKVLTKSSLRKTASLSLKKQSPSQRRNIRPKRQSAPQCRNAPPRQNARQSRKRSRSRLRFPPKRFQKPAITLKQLLTALRLQTPRLPARLRTACLN